MTTPTELLLCARKAYPNIEWALDNCERVYQVGTENTEGGLTGSGIYCPPKHRVYFSLTNSADVLALWKALAKEGVMVQGTPEYEGSSIWWWESERLNLESEEFDTLEECLAAAVVALECER